MQTSESGIQPAGRDVDVAIVGAGPAGARAAELLARAGASVAVIDPRAPWEKPCGGGLTASAFTAFPELRELSEGMRAVRRVRVETTPSVGFSFLLETPVYMVSRAVLGRWQLDRALRAGATLLAERVRSVHRDRMSHWHVETDVDDVVARFIVGADGAASLVRRIVAPKLQVELAPTRVAFVPGAGPTPNQMTLQFFPETVGYVWDFPRPDHRSVGVGTQRGEWARPRMDSAVDALRRSSEACDCRDEELERAGAVIGTAQFGHGDFHFLGGEDFALLGDAAGLADPTSGEGIRNAFRSAQLLAEAWGRDGTFSRYPALARRAFDREFHVSRAARHILLERGAAVRMIGAAARRSDGVMALLGACLDALNEHDLSLLGLARRWRRVRRRIRADREDMVRGRRTPEPCHASDQTSDGRLLAGEEDSVPHGCEP